MTTNDLTPESLLAVKRKFLSDESKSMRELGQMFGIRIYVDQTMRPNDWKIVCGTEAYGKMLSPIKPHLLTPDSTNE